MERNPVTQTRHRREVLWQITIPVVVGALVLLLLAFLAAFQTSMDQASIWADISLIWMIVPALIAVLIFFLFLAASIYLAVRLIGVLPGYFFMAHGWLLLAGDRLRQAEGKMVEPVLRARSFTARLEMLKRQARKE
jgi:hypothetical protein